MTPGYLNGTEAMTYLSIGRTLFYELVALGVIHPYGRRPLRRYRIAELDDLISRGIPTAWERQRLHQLKSARENAKARQSEVQK